MYLVIGVLSWVFSGQELSAAPRASGDYTQYATHLPSIIIHMNCTHVCLFCTKDLDTCTHVQIIIRYHTCTLCIVLLLWTSLIHVDITHVHVYNTYTLSSLDAQGRARGACINYSTFYMYS